MPPVVELARPTGEGLLVVEVAADRLSPFEGPQLNHGAALEEDLWGGRDAVEGGVHAARRFSLPSRYPAWRSDRGTDSAILYHRTHSVFIMPT